MSCTHTNTHTRMHTHVCPGFEAKSKTLKRMVERDFPLCSVGSQSWGRWGSTRLIKEREMVKAGTKALMLKQHGHSRWRGVFPSDWLESCLGRRWQMSVSVEAGITTENTNEQAMKWESDLQVNQRQQGTWDTKHHSQDDFQYLYWLFNGATA